jgi:hypothetical protein
VSGARNLVASGEADAKRGNAGFESHWHRCGAVARESRWESKAVVNVRRRPRLAEYFSPAFIPTFCFATSKDPAIFMRKLPSPSPSPPRRVSSPRVPEM